jgi:trimethylamine--corrinoid protein Co-methyltransferase
MNEVTMMLSGKVLSDIQIEKVCAAAEDILERAGCRVLDQRAVALCGKAGAKVDETNGTVRLPRQLLRELVAQAPSHYGAKGVDGVVRQVGNGRQWGLAITNDPWIVQYETQQPRRPCSEDVRRNTIIGQSLDRVMGMSCMDFPMSDVPGPHASLHALEVHLLHHTKHNFILATSVESLELWLRIGRILARGQGLRGSRLFTVAVATLTPLTVTEMNVEFMRIACDFDLPIVPTVCPTAGMTSPYTLAGTLALGHAEILFLLALTQLHRPGHPFLYAFGPAVGNMQSGACLYYTLDKVLWKLAAVQLGKSYGLPVAAECGGTMVHRIDQQSGAEGMLFMLAAVTSGADTLAGFGSTHNAIGHSTEMMLIQDAYAEAAQFMRRGINTDAAHLAVESAVRVGSAGEYLTDELTLEHLRGDEFFRHEIFDQAGDSTQSQSMLERAHERVTAMIDGFRSPVPEDIQEALRRFFREETNEA